MCMEVGETKVASHDLVQLVLLLALELSFSVLLSLLVLGSLVLVESLGIERPNSFG